MAKVIKFQIPSNFQKKTTELVHTDQRGRVIEFGSMRKSA